MSVMFEILGHEWSVDETGVVPPLRLDCLGSRSYHPVLAVEALRVRKAGRSGESREDARASTACARGGRGDAGNPAHASEIDP